MLRAYDRPGGIGIYSRNIVKYLLKADKDNHYILLYNNEAHLGTYGGLPNVDEIYMPAVNQVLWDQWYTRKVLKKYNADLVFNTKFSVPLATKLHRVMVLHGSSWFVHPELYKKFDILYVRQAMPVYCKAADFLISNSDLTTRDFIRILDIPSEKIQTVNLAAGEEFVPISDASQLESIRKKYQLPERFILTVTSYDPRKNFGTLLKAFELCRQHVDINLVVVGKDCHRYIEDFRLKDRALDTSVYFPGWIDQQHLPAIYNLADAFVFPSVYEEFGIPVIEAISCGCPVVCSNTGAIPELLGDAALTSDPFDQNMLAENLLQIITSEKSAKHFREAGLGRAKNYSWEKTAQQTLEILNRIA
jgi:glycosyltransferase involved in cell wall biosynthesis